MTARTAAARGRVGGRRRGGDSIRETLAGSRASDRHERQANERGRQFVAGRDGLGAGLFASPAAPIVITDSVAHSLPHGLRDSLERAYSADLSGVRVHHDAPASAAARALGARAFATGPSVYFADGAYRPETLTGQALIAHEVTHVLQQVGRASSAGKLRVDQLHGTGPVLCQWSSPLPTSIVSGTEADLISGHLDLLNPAAPEHAVVQGLIRGSEALGAGARRSYWEARAGYVMSGGVDPELGASPGAVAASIASALYDGLKVSGRIAAAALLLHQRHDLRTLFFSAPTYERYVDDRADFDAVKQRLYEDWYSHAWFGSGTPRSMLDRTLKLLLGPTVSHSRQTVPAGNLIDSAPAELDRRHAGELGPNELHYITVLVARDLERERYDLLERLLRDASGLAGSNPTTLANLKLTIAIRLRDLCVDLVRRRDTLLAPANLPADAIRESRILLLQDFVPALRDLAQYAINFWGFYAPFNTSLRSDRLIEGSTVLAEAELATIDTALPGYRGALQEFFHAVLDRNNDGSLPDPAAFAARRDVAVGRLDAELSRIVERPLAQRLHAALPSGDPSQRAFSFDVAAANRALSISSGGLYVWALVKANELRRLALSTYDLAADTTLIARQRGVDPQAPATDLRDFFRVRLALAAIHLAGDAGWDEWTAWMRPIVEAGEISLAGNPVGGDYVAFRTDWQLDNQAEIGRMAEDFPRDLKGFEPLTPGDLVEFYLAQEYSTLTGHIDRLAGANQGLYTLGANPLLSQALTAARAEFRPQRYVIREWEWVTRWTEFLGFGHRRRSPRSDARQLIQAHPLTKARIRDSQSTQGGEIASAVNVAMVDGREAPVLWILPPPVELVSRLREVPEVNRWVLAALPRLISALPGLLSDTTVSSEDRDALRRLVASIESGQAFRPSVGGATPTPPQRLQQLTVSTLMALRWEPWWNLWRAILSVQSDGQGAELIGNLRRALSDAGFSAALSLERQGAAEDALAAQRRAIAHERRRIVEGQLRPALSHFDPRSWNRYQIPGRGPVRIERTLADEVATRLERFVTGLPDLEEREGHLAMAVFELADPIHEKLGQHRGLSDVVAWVPLIDSALYWAAQARRGADPSVRDSFTVGEEQGNSALFEARRDKLRLVLDHMAVVLREQFMQWGVVGVPGDGTIESPGSAYPVGRESRTVSRGTAFTISGRTWEILQVETAFTFHPGSFALRSMQNREVAGSMLKIGNGPYLAEGERPHTLLMRVMINEGPEPTEIYADRDRDTEILTELTWALQMHATLENLGELAAAIEFSGGLALDAAELFPGGGQAVAAARLITTALAFIEGELPQMIEHFVTNPREVLDSVWGRLQTLLSTEQVLGFLLFSNSNFDGLIREPRSRGPRQLGGSTSRRMRRLLFSLQTFGRRLGRIFVRVHDSVQDRRQQVEHLVQNSPRVVSLIQIVADYYLVAASVADQLPDLPGALSDFRTNAQALPGRIDEMIASLGQITLPAEILPRARLVDVLLDVIGQRLGGKYKLGVHILMQLLDAIGARERIVQAIADALGAAGFRTPILFPAWGESIVPGIQRFLQTAQVELRGTLDSTFGRFQAPLGLAAPSADVTLAGDMSSDDGPEAQPSLDEEVQGGLQALAGGATMSAGEAGEHLERIASTGGEPLPPAVLADAEARLGHDFSHVRLHRDPRSADLTRSLGARALTSGSHLVLGDGARDAVSPGSRVLYHELAHVVQQTGGRPPDTRPIPPREGRAGRGVRWDPQAELEAEQVSATAVRGHAVRVQPAGGRLVGWQPNMIEFYGQQFLRQLVDVTAIEAEVAGIDVTRSGTGPRLIGRDVRRAVAHVGANLREKFRPGPRGLRAAVGGTYHGKLDIISTHLLAAQADLAAAVEDIAIRASVEAEPAREGRPARMVLQVSDFVRRLERYIFGKTGILLELNAPTRGTGATAVFQDVRQPFQSADVKFVFLANVHGNSRLWLDALTHQTTALGGQGAPIADPAARARWRTQIRPVLRDLGPSSSIWVSNAYRFSLSIFEAAQELERLQELPESVGTLPPTSLPSRDHYLNVAGADPTPGYGNQRLHQGTFDQKASGEQRGTERESHHLTQYLLVEYFHNGSTAAPESNQDRMGFPLLRRRSDAYGSDMQVTGAGAPLSFRDVEIDVLEQGRGGRMPTILLARGTHRRGNLHIDPRADDFNNAPISTQAAAVNHLYKNALPPAQRILEREVVNQTQPYQAWEDYKRIHAQDFSTRIFNAMQATYGYMRTFMQRQLRTGLIGIERSYYNDLYAAAHPTSDLQPLTVSDMNHKADQAIQHNRYGDAARGIRGLESYGWRG